MMVTGMVKAGIAALAALLLSASLPDKAQAQEPNAECIEAVGTFLTRDRFADRTSSEYTARSLISLTNGGHAFRNDSDQNAGETGFTFGEGRGAWRCQGQEGTVIRLTARMLNFIYPSADQNQALIGRMDYSGTYDSEQNVLRLNARLGFVPLEADPLLGDLPDDAIDVEIVGLKIEAP